MKHSNAKNVIERCFGLLRKRWSIIRSPSFIPIRTQSCILMACYLLHNLIRIMPTDFKVDEIEDEVEKDENDEGEVEFITIVQTFSIGPISETHLPNECPTIREPDLSLDKK